MCSLVSRPGVLIPPGLVLCLIAGCGPDNTYQEAPPTKVNVALPVKQTVINYLEETGTTEAVQSVEVRARVEGVLYQTDDWEPGTDVEAGTVLYKIEPDVYAARVDSAKADLMAQQAVREKAEIEKKRQERLRARDPGATSETAVVAAQAEFKGAEAAVKQAEAQLRQAEIDFDYTTITMPITGRVGKTLVKPGNLVGSGGQATPLTIVTQYNPIWANFNISERELLELLAEGRGGRNDGSDPKLIPIYLSRDTDVGFPFEGHFDYADFAVDQSMGTFMIRGVFPNPDHLILPGLFVRIRIPRGKQEDALLVPERALGFDQAGEFLLIVNDQNEVQRRNVKMGSKFEGLVVINEGLKEGELVVIDGLQRTRPGATVAPQEVTLEAGSEVKEVVRSNATEAPPPVGSETGSPDDSPPQESPPSTDSPGAAGIPAEANEL